MTKLARRARAGLVFLIVAMAFGFYSVAASAAPYAAMVMDARTGEVLHARNADTRLHPASLTKMMTLYLAFEAIERGALSLDTQVTISRKAADEPPSRLGLRAGQKIAMRHLIRAAAIRSANDAATAIGEAISGSEARFAERMNATARALGMNSTSFRNAHGLTAAGHLSTARDMTILGRRLFYDYPQYYNIFSRRTADAGIAQVANTNRRFLDSYAGADGIKTGYTRAAGFNLVSSAERGNKRIIATVFGGDSTAHRNARMAELLDMGFDRAPNRVREIRPAPLLIAEAPTGPATQSASQATVQTAARGSVQLSSSPRPSGRPRPVAPVVTDQAVAMALAAPMPGVADQAEAAAADARAVAVAEALAAEMAAEVAASVSPVEDTPAPAPIVSASGQAPASSPRPAAAAGARGGGSQTVQLAAAAPAEAADVPAEVATTLDIAEALDLAEAEKITPTSAPAAGGPVFIQTTEAQPETRALAAQPRRSDTVILASLTPEIAAPAEEPEVVARLSTSGGRHWGISLGRFPSQSHAERMLLRTALMESETLDDSLRKIAARSNGFEANFVGLSEDGARLACQRLAARNTECEVIGP